MSYWSHSLQTLVVAAPPPAPELLRFDLPSRACRTNPLNGTNFINMLGNAIEEKVTCLSFPRLAPGHWNKCFALFP
jgi:hypothetical protein